MFLTLISLQSKYFHIKKKKKKPKPSTLIVKISQINPHPTETMLVVVW